MRRAEVWRAAWETVRKPFLERRYTSRDLLYSPSYRRRARDRPNATSDHSLQPPHDAAGGSSGALLFSSRPWPRSYWVGTRKSPHYKKSDILLTRDKITTRSVDAAFMIRPGIAYIHIHTFNETTNQELTKALDSLGEQNIKGLIL